MRCEWQLTHDQSGRQNISQWLALVNRYSPWQPFAFLSELSLSAAIRHNLSRYFRSLWLLGPSYPPRPVARQGPQIHPQKRAAASSAGPTGSGHSLQKPAPEQDSRWNFAPSENHSLRLASTISWLRVCRDALKLKDNHMKTNIEALHPSRIFRRTAVAGCGWSLLCLAKAVGDDTSHRLAPATAAQQPPAGDAKPPDLRPLQTLLQEIRAEFHLPALAMGIVTPTGLRESGCVGVRQQGDTTPVTSDDLWHLGSCTKAMTATMIASLVQQGLLHWDTKLVDLFPELSAQMSDDFRRITLTQLLTHRSGLPANGPWRDLGDQHTTTVQRRRLLENMLVRGLEHPPGTMAAYSNVGYALAGLMAETVTGQAWEDLMRQRLFGPLNMPSVGFGVPGTLGQVDQPWGHHSTWLGLGPLKAVQLDNAASLGPAGTVHASLYSWCQFLAAHLTSDPHLLPADIWETLHSPAKSSPANPDDRADGDAANHNADQNADESFAMGWLVLSRPWAGTGDRPGLALTHSGSNTVNHCVCWLAPERKFGILACTNTGQANAAKALDRAVSELIIRRFSEPHQPAEPPK